MDKMNRVLVFLIMALAGLLYPSNVYALYHSSSYAEEVIVMEDTMQNGEVKVQLFWPEVLPDKLYVIDLKFLDPDTDELLEDLSITYIVTVTQNDHLIEQYHEQNTTVGRAQFEVLFPEDSIGSAQVFVAITSISNGSTVRSMNEEVSFNVQVVPEFGLLSVLVMTVAIGITLLFYKLKYRLYV